MTDWLPSDFSLPALLPRTLGTAAVVVSAGWAAMRLGPLAGGLLAGLPLVMGPGFFFLLRQTPAAVVAQMAAHTLLALCAVPVYLLAYMAALRHWPPWRALLGAVPAWVGAAWLLHAGAAYLALDQGPGRALALFALLTAAAGVWGVRLRLPRPSPPGPAGWAQLVQRGLLAGAVIGWITTASHWLGPALAGALIGFPVVFSAATLTLHQRQRLAARGLARRGQSGRFLRGAGLGLAALAPLCGFCRQRGGGGFRHCGADAGAPPALEEMKLMDEIVQQALRKWPNVPACHGWLALDVRGQWWMRDERAQASGAFGSGRPGSQGARLAHPGLLAFIARNYAADAQGRWFFQNGPQRVFVTLQAAPWVWRVLGEGRIEPHTGGPALAPEGVQACVLDEQGRLFLATAQGLGIVHPQDMLHAAGALEAGAWPSLQELPFARLPEAFAYVLNP